MILMSDKWFIVGETLRDYYQIKCEKKDYSRVLAPNTVARLLNKQQTTIEEQNKQIEESKITIQLYETDVSMRDNFLKSKGLYDEFLQCILAVNE